MPRPEYSRAVATAVACAGVGTAVQMPYFWAAFPPGRSFFLGYVALLLAVHAATALVFGHPRWAWLWPVLVFLMPIAAPLLALSFSSHLSPLAWRAIVATLLVWGAHTFRRAESLGGPVLASAGGSILGAEICRFHLVALKGFATAPAEFARLLLVGLLVAVALWGGRRLPAAFTWPAVMPALGTALASLVFAWIAGPGRILGDRLPAPAATGAATAAQAPIVLIVMDTVRADHLKAYGYERDTMPQLEKFARRECIRVTRGVTNYPSSLEAHSSIFTGLYPPHHGAAWGRWRPDDPGNRLVYPLPEETKTLAELLSAHGYWSVALSGNYGPLSPELGLAQGFAIYRANRNDLRRRTPFGVALDFLVPPRIRSHRSLAWSEFFSSTPYRRAESLTDLANEVVARAGERPFFLFINYFDAHDPVHPPLAYRDAFPGRQPELDSHGVPRFGGLPKHITDAVLGDDRDLTRRESEHVRASYDAALRSIDAQLGRLFARLRQHPRFDDMLVIVTADHGEAMGDHRFLGHGAHLYDELLHVPLFIKPGSLESPAHPGLELPRVVQSVDLFAIALAHAGIAAPAGIDGRAWGSPAGPAFAWSYANSRLWPWPERFLQQLRAVEMDGMKLITSSDGSSELYDLRADPQEVHDLSKDRKDQVERLAALLPEASPAAEAKPLGEGSEAVLERLRSLGYVQ